MTIKRLDEMESAYDGAFVRVRHSLGVESFGMQVINLPPDTDRYPEHDHSADGQEEVYIVLKGSGEIEVDGRRHPIDPETFVRVGPALRRRVFAGPEGISLLALGGVAGEAYVAPAFSKPDAA